MKTKRPLLKKIIIIIEKANEKLKKWFGTFGSSTYSSGLQTVGLREDILHALHCI